MNSFSDMLFIHLKLTAIYFDQAICFDEIWVFYVKDLIWNFSIEHNSSLSVSPVHRNRDVYKPQSYSITFIKLTAIRLCIHELGHWQTNSIYKHFTTMLENELNQILFIQEKNSTLLIAIKVLFTIILRFISMHRIL